MIGGFNIPWYAAIPFAVILFVRMFWKPILIILIFMALAMGPADFWYTENGVFKELRAKHPEIKRIVIANRALHFIGDTIIVTENTDKTKTVYRLDSNIFFNYRFEKKNKEKPDKNGKRRKNS